MSPFTKEVLASLDFLRQAIADASKIDSELGDTLTAITDDLVINLENQMLLVFGNIGVRRKAEEDALLRARTDVGLLEHYRTACADNAKLSIDDRTSRVTVDNQHDPTPKLTALPPESPALFHEASVQRTLLTGAHLFLESLGYLIGVERTTLFLAQKGTGTLRVVACAPDVSLARRGAFLACHQGIVGSVYSTGIAIRADMPTPETRRSFIEPVDELLGTKTDNVLVFPVVDKATGVPIGAIECANKAIGFSEEDENLMAQACRLLWYVLCYHEIDFHNGMVFNPAAIHAVRPYRAEILPELMCYHGAASVAPRQLIVRLKDNKPDNLIDATARALGLHAPEGEVPPAVKGKHNLADTVEVGPLGRVKELKSYLSKVEEAHRHIMAELVTAQNREGELREDVTRKSHKIRLLEENTQALHEQLVEARQTINRGSFAPLSDANAADFESSMVTLGSFLKRGQSDRLPPINSVVERQTNEHHEGIVSRAEIEPRTVMQQASDALKELKRLATVSNPEGQVSIRMFSTPDPKAPRLQPLGHTHSRRSESAVVQYQASKTLSKMSRRS